MTQTQRLLGTARSSHARRRWCIKGLVTQIHVNEKALADDTARRNFSIGALRGAPKPSSTASCRKTTRFLQGTQAGPSVTPSHPDLSVDPQNVRTISGDSLTTVGAPWSADAQFCTVLLGQSSLQMQLHQSAHMTSFRTATSSQVHAIVMVRNGMKHCLPAVIDPGRTASVYYTSSLQ